MEITDSIEEFDREKTRVLKYITYQKRTEQEVRNKFQNTIKENLLEDIISYLKEAGYLDDKDYVEKAVREILLLRHLSKKEIAYKLQQKGVKRNLVEDYFSSHEEELRDYEIQSAIHLIEKKKREKDNLTIQRMLYTKGYERELVAEAFQKIEGEG